MFLYVIASGEFRKIGMASNIRGRLGSIACHNPLPVTLDYHHACPIDRVLRAEALAHEALATKKIRGEWFAVSKARAIAAVRNAISTALDEPQPKAATREDIRRQLMKRASAVRIAAGIKGGAPREYSVVEMELCLDAWVVPGKQAETLARAQAAVKRPVSYPTLWRWAKEFKWPERGSGKRPRLKMPKKRKRRRTK